MLDATTSQGFTTENLASPDHGYSLVLSFLLMSVEAATALPVACPHMGQHGQFGQRQGRPQAVQWLLLAHEKK